MFRREIRQEAAILALVVVNSMNAWPTAKIDELGTEQKPKPYRLAAALQFGKQPRHEDADPTEGPETGPDRPGSSRRLE